ncbi:sn-glycerol-3-phosphate import ATP-binding protein UgpC [Roseibium sp. TrichSKD4]|uniref:ABC transporter ATP-binding protein n=1 Tax=Roseibium sp. TrichSKD4 TaxID=744980 RepID=UPI0001E56E7E|nr:ABC transporter ATP-binding protein [Roseibium sp. TrichSKD4]EFO32021.1 sn-glycerol-3-phosphate import ATP-binding protein UgpC [Roseibium sp. TrichSKD4]
MSYLDLSNIRKSFENETVLDGISLSVPEGGTLVLFGKSGAGKTVLLRTIAGAIDPDAGSVTIGGQDMTTVPPEHRGIGMAFQNFALFPHMSAFDNIASSLTSRRMSASEIKRKVQDVAELLKIDHVLTHTPKALSNGQKQRTALARALVSEPKVLLLDDPLRNVDAKLRFEMRLELPCLLADRGATVVYVTQDYKEAMALGERIAVLDQGNIVQIGSPEDIYKRPANTEIAQLFGDPTVNLLDVVPQEDERGLHAFLSDQRVDFHGDFPGVAGRDCIVGLRPEALSFTQNGGFPVTIEAVTPFNEKTVTLVTTLRGREILVSQPAQSTVPEGPEQNITISAQDAILFDRQTGKRLEPVTTGERVEEAA